MLHVSDIKRYKRCPRLYYLNKDIYTPFQPYLRHDEELTKLLVEYFKLEDYYLGIRGDDATRVLEALDKYEWFVKARFEYYDLRVKIPLIHKVDDAFDIYFAAYMPSPREEDAEFYKANLWVLKNCGLKIKDVYVVHLNGEYIRGDELDLDELFIVSKTLYNKKAKPTLVLNDFINASYDLKNTIDAMHSENLEMHKPIKARRCKRKIMCEHYKECFNEEFEDNSIEFLVSSKYKEDMLKEGIKYLRDADYSRLEGTKAQYAQIMADRHGGLFIDKFALEKWLDVLKDKTLAFIDFEWETYIIPPYKGLKPYEQLCFEYSLHLLKKDGTLAHREFLQTGDCREDFIRSLIKDVPKDAYLLAYNAKGAEMVRLKELARQFPMYQPMLDDMNERFIDMSYPFLEGMVYDTRIRGDYSVKSLVRVVSKMSYSSLDIQNGMDAVYIWRTLDRKDEQNDEKDVKLRLSEYCSLDSYSLYLMYKWLIDILSKY